MPGTILRMANNRHERVGVEGRRTHIAAKSAFRRVKKWCKRDATVSRAGTADAHAQIDKKSDESSIPNPRSIAVDSRISQLERAFELASSGRCASVADIKRKLREEGYMDDQVEGPVLFGQLNSLMKKSNGQAVRNTARPTGSGSSAA